MLFGSGPDRRAARSPAVGGGDGGISVGGVDGRMVADDRPLAFDSGNRGPTNPSLDPGVPGAPGGPDRFGGGPPRPRPPPGPRIPRSSTVLSSIAAAPNASAALPVNTLASRSASAT